MYLSPPLNSPSPLPPLADATFTASSLLGVLSLRLCPPPPVRRLDDRARCRSVTVLVRVSVSHLDGQRVKRAVSTTQQSNGVDCVLKRDR